MPLPITTLADMDTLNKLAFRVCLPLPEAPPVPATATAKAPPRTPEASPPPAAGPLRMLVVDDHRD